MHPDLSPHLHTEECNLIIKEFHKCHQDHPFLKFTGKCNDQDRQLWKCLKNEREQQRLANRQKRKIRSVSQPAKETLEQR